MIELMVYFLFCVVGVRFLNQCIAPIWSSFFITKGREAVREGALFTGVPGNDVTIEFVVPLFCEQHNVHAIFERFGALLRTFPSTRFTLITTQREFDYPMQGETTQVVVRRCLMELPEILRERIVVWNYPGKNRNLAEQLNGYLQLQHANTDHYFGLYNADSIPTMDAVRYVILRLRQQRDGVLQQSSLFLQNEAVLANAGQYFALANGIAQSIWTFSHEIPRLLGNECFPNARLAHCVTHGVFIRSDVLRDIGYFPEDSPGEDLYLGFLLRAMGQVIHPIPYLESSTTPASIRAVLRQKYVWFWGPLGYWYYWKRFRDRFPLLYHERKFWIALLTIQGVLSSLAWLFVSPILIIITISAALFHWGYIVPVLLYAWIPGMMLCYRTGNVSGARLFAILFFLPLVLYTHSIPAWCTVIAHGYYSLTGWKTFFRPKTG